jgi:hypothetical protein
VGHDLNRARTVCGADAGADAARRIDADLKIGFETLAVPRNHLLHAELL